MSQPEHQTQCSFGRGPGRLVLGANVMYPKKLAATSRHDCKTRLAGSRRCRGRRGPTMEKLVTVPRLEAWFVWQPASLTRGPAVLPDHTVVVLTGPRASLLGFEGATQHSQTLEGHQRRSRRGGRSAASMLSRELPRRLPRPRCPAFGWGDRPCAHPRGPRVQCGPACDSWGAGSPSSTACVTSASPSRSCRCPSKPAKSGKTMFARGCRIAGRGRLHSLHPDTRPAPPCVTS